MSKKEKQSQQDAGSGEDALIAQRRGKAERVRERGDNPFANDVALARELLADIRAQFAEALLEPASELRYDPEKVEALAAGKERTVLGRLVARRGFGKASFLRLRDDTDELQLFAKKDLMGEAFESLADLDVADHIEAVGLPMVTKTGELSLQVSKLRLLTKALRPLPDKWHGLSDVDLRYRRRYVDLVANPAVASAFRARSVIVQALREFLDSRRFLEVETPMLHTLIGGAAAKPFNTHHNALDLELFLRIAPELYLKRLLVGGFERVYEIGRCFRNEGLSTRHNPEFTMLEYYQAYANYDILMDQTEEMFRFVDQRLEQRMAELGRFDIYAAWKAERRYTLDEAFVRLPMTQAISQAAAKAGLPENVIELLPKLAVRKDMPAEQKAPGDELVRGWTRSPASEAQGKRAKQIDWGNFRKGLGGCDNEGELIFCAYEYLAEPFLPEDYRSGDGSLSVPVFIIDYPAEVSPLARRKDANPALTDRFELFVDGREICNAFSELNDPDDQKARFEEQVDKKSRGADETMDYDADYIRALEHGMPPAAGFGLGVDRLTMLLACQASIRDVIAFPLLRPEAR